jgi:glutaredoxin
MATICPKCNTFRPANASVPEWQCPACGVAYAKAADAVSDAKYPGARARVARAAVHEEHGVLAALPWSKLLFIALIAVGGWFTYQHVAKTGPMTTAGAGGEARAVDLQTLAANSSARDVMMYTTSWCGYCKAARTWLTDNGFKFQECVIDTNRDCAEAFDKIATRRGVPYVIVKGKVLPGGFNPERFVQAMTKKS